MGMMIDGVWRRDDGIWARGDGRFERAATTFRNWVTPDGSPGTAGEGGFRAEPGRYVLYVSLACPWAHRALIFRRLKGLEEAIPVSVVHWRMLDEGWTFGDGPGVVPDPVFGARVLSEVYAKADKTFTGRVTVPVLFDTRTGRIVSNESSEIIRMLNSAFDGVGAAPGDFYPAALRPEIDAVNERVYPTLNNGVYRAGFARSQQAYEEAIGPLFDTLDWLEERLSRRRYVAGETITEADWRLFTTLVRFDAVYVGHFKCNVRRVVDYPALSAYLRELYQWPGVAETVDFRHIKGHYYESHRSINPTGIVPVGPALDLESPHGRG